MQVTRNIFFYALSAFIATALILSGLLYYFYKSTLERELQHMSLLLEQELSFLLPTGQADSGTVASGSPEQALARLSQAYERWSVSGFKREIILASDSAGDITVELYKHNTPQQHNSVVPGGIQHFEPMLLALQKRKGTLTTTGLSGQQVAAVYDYIPSLKMGVVDTLDISELKSHFIELFLTAMALALLVAIVSAIIIERTVDRARQESEKAKISLLRAQHSAGLGYIEFDLKKRSLKFSDQAKELFQQTASLDLPHTDLMMECVHPVDKPKLAELFNTPRDDVDSFNFEFQLILADESVRWVHLTAEYRKNHRGHKTLLFMTVRDITEEKNSEIELKKSMRELNNYKAALDEFAIVAITDRNGKMMHVNDMFCKLSGFSRQELIGHNHRLLNSGYHDKEFFVNLWRTVSRGEIWKGDIKNKKKNGEFHWVSTTIVPFTNHENKIDRFISIRTDVTEKKELETRQINYTKTLIRKIKELERANNTRADFLSRASHEIRTPLKIANEFITVLDNETLGKNNAQQKKCITTIRNKFDDLESLMNDMQDLQKIDTRQIHLYRVEFDLSALLSEIHAQYLPRCRNKNIDLMLHKPETPVLALGDTDKITQAVHNLLDNAVRFTPEGHIDIELISSEEECTVSIRDTGIGIDPVNHYRIFDRFTQIEPESDILRNSSNVGELKRTGGGLGLSISQSMLELHESGIFVQSEPGAGSTFGFKLPVYEPTIGVKALISDTSLSANKPLSDVHVGLIQIIIPRSVDYSELDKQTLQPIFRQGQDRLITIPSANLICIAALSRSEDYPKIYKRLLLGLQSRFGSSLALVKYDGSAQDTLRRLTEEYNSVELLLNDWGRPCREVA